MDASNPDASIEVTVFETTPVAPAWRVVSRQVIVTPADDRLLVSESVFVENPNDRTWLGSDEASNGKLTTIELTLPERTENITLHAGFHGWCCTTFESGTLGVQMPLMPGRYNYQFTYEVLSEDEACSLAFGDATDREDERWTRRKLVSNTWCERLLHGADRTLPTCLHGGDARRAVRELAQLGVKVVVGSGLVTEIAQEMGLEAILIYSRQGVVKAFEEAIRLASAKALGGVRRNSQAYTYHNEQDLIGNSKAVEKLRNTIRLCGSIDFSVLIQGKTGVGKELVAQSIHTSSPRAGKPFVAINCASLTESLLESELFGYEEGAFSGAVKGGRAGMFESAQGGTVFLDEIGDMPLALQSKLLRALEDKAIQRVGGGEDVPVDFRLVCATHQKIEQKVDDGSFRSDLYFRINVFPVQVPTLAERSVDIPLIAEAILEQITTDQKIVKPNLDDSAWSELSRYPWPGNIRELRNVLERAAVLFSSEVITGAHVKENLLRLKVPDRREEQDALWEASEELMGIDSGVSTSLEQPLPHPSHYADWFSYFDTIDLRRHLRDVEVVLIEAALEKSEGMVSHAANALKLQRTTLIEKMKKLMIERPTPSKSESEARSAS